MVFSYILKVLVVKHEFSYPDEKLISLVYKLKTVLDDKAKYPDWTKREDIKAEINILLAENFKKYNK